MHKRSCQYHFIPATDKYSNLLQQKFSFPTTQVALDYRKFKHKQHSSILNKRFQRGVNYSDTLTWKVASA